VHPSQVFDWWPLSRLLRVEPRDDAEDFTTFELSRMLHLQRKYIAVCERDVWPPRKLTTTIEIEIPGSVIRELTDEQGVIFTIRTNVADPWREVEATINAAAERVAQRYLPFPGRTET
jgi:hypothetical protein